MELLLGQLWPWSFFFFFLSASKMLFLSGSFFFCTTWICPLVVCFGQGHKSKTIASFLFFFCLSLLVLKPWIFLFRFLLTDFTSFLLSGSQKHFCSCLSDFQSYFITEKKSSKWFCVTTVGVNCCLSPGAHITPAGLLLLCYMMQCF